MSKIIATIVVAKGDRVSVRQTSRIVGYGYLIENQVIESGKIGIEVDSNKKYNVTVNDFQHPPATLEAGNNYFE